MKKLITNIAKDKVQLVCYLITFFLLFFYLVISFFVYRSLPPVLPLFNQLPWGDARVGVKPLLFLPFGIALASLLVNGFLNITFFRDVPLIARILLITSLLITIIAILFLVQTLLLVLT